MLDLNFHQGAGLRSFAPHTEIRVLAVASQGDNTMGLEVLWQICASLQKLGYPVVVLDGTAQETEASPGLTHLLDQASWNDSVSMNTGASASSLAVIPAARGLVRASREALLQRESPWRKLLPHFRTYGLMVLHAPAPTLGPLLTHTSTVPLVVMGNGASGAISSYKSIKQIALHTAMPCMVAALLPEDTAVERHKARASLDALQVCAQRHLGGPIRATTIATGKPQELQRLALQLLENAGTITESLTALPAPHFSTLTAQFVRSH